jgi:hypothetical protein
VLVRQHIACGLQHVTRDANLAIEPKHLEAGGWGFHWMVIEGGSMRLWDYLGCSGINDSRVGDQIEKQQEQLSPFNEELTRRHTSLGERSLT